MPLVASLLTIRSLPFAGKPILPSYLAKVERSKRAKLINDVDGSYHAYMRMLTGRYAKEMLAKVRKLMVGNELPP